MKGSQPNGAQGLAVDSHSVLVLRTLNSDCGDSACERASLYHTRVDLSRQLAGAFPALTNRVTIRINVTTLFQ